MSAATMIKSMRDAGGTASATWDPVAGCGNGSKVTLQCERLDRPQRRRRPRRVFVTADLFRQSVGDEHIARVWQVMASCPRHMFLILTQQPVRMRDWLNRCARWDGYITHNGEPVSSYGGGGWIVGCPDAPRRRPGWDDRGPRGGKPRYKPSPVARAWPLPNVWLGVSAPDQDRADIANLNDRIQEARLSGWLGEVEGLRTSRDAAARKLVTLDRMQQRQPALPRWAISLPVIVETRR
jgi:hypothetical protein